MAIARAYPALEESAIRAIADNSPSTSTRQRFRMTSLPLAVESQSAGRRVLGYRLAALGAWPVERIAAGLSDRDALVRHAAIAALRGREDAVAALRPRLADENAQTRLAAIEALGEAGATDTLFEYLRQNAFPRIAAYRAWRGSLPSGNATWLQIARLAMIDADHQAVEEVLQTLAALGHDQTIRYIRRFMDAGDERMRARAAEAITAFDERNLITPLLPLLDNTASRGAKRLPQSTIIAQMKMSSSPWLRRAAMLAEPKEIPMSSNEQGLLDRLLFLRNVPIFESCSLDDLYAIHQVMTSFGVP